jgi:hypothetical protein
VISDKTHTIPYSYSKDLIGAAARVLAECGIFETAREAITVEAKVEPAERTPILRKYVVNQQ